MVGRIIAHSLRQVFGNMGGVLRVSAVLTLAQFAVIWLFGRSVLFDPQAMEAMIRSGTFPYGRFLAVIVIQLFLGLWIVVGWHRYVLLNEQPGIVPMPQPGRILGYFGKSFLIGLIVVIAGLALGFVVGFIITALFSGGGRPRDGATLPIMLTMAILVYLPLSYLGLRLSVSLPGVALQPGVPLFSGWQATRDASMTILGLVIVALLAGAGIELLKGFLFATNPVSLPSIVFGLVVQWLFTMIGASVMTTLYGHYVEGRPLV